MMNRKELAEHWAVDEPTPGFADRTVALLEAPRRAESVQRRRAQHGHGGSRQAG